MRLLTGWLIRTALVTAAFLLSWWLIRRLGVPVGLAAWAGIAAGMSAVAMLLLRYSPLGRIGWQNRIAGLLMPWAGHLGRGSLFGMAVASWVVWVTIGSMAAAARARGSLWGDEASAAAVSPVRTVLAASTWAILGALLTWQAGLYARNYGAGGRQGLTMLKVAACLAGLMVASIGLWLAGRPGAALAVSGIPIAAAGLLIGGFTLLMVTAGRNARWN